MRTIHFDETRNRGMNHLQIARGVLDTEIDPLHAFVRAIFLGTHTKGFRAIDNNIIVVLPLILHSLVGFQRK